MPSPESPSARPSPPQALNCPTCGGTVAHESTQCQYCGALLRTVACPSCFAMMFQGAKFCPRCGCKTDQLRPEEVAAHPCPRCSVPFKAVRVGGVELEECPHCGGVWVSCEAFDRICSDRERQTAALGIDVPPAPAADTTVRYLKCPQCTQLMNRRNYAHRSGVIIDVCRRHGIWLDRDELRRIIEFIRAGGLDRAREVEIEQLQRERQQLESSRMLAQGTGVDSSGAVNPDRDFSILRGVLSWLFT